MFKKIIEDIKIARLVYLIEMLKTKDLNTKVKVFKKLDKMKITTKMGLEILKNSTYEFGIKDGNGGINSSLVSLCMKDYKKEYSDKILKNFNKYDDEAKNQIVYLLSSIDNENALKLYADLIVKYYKDKEFIPISNLYERVNSYKILFPKLYKAVKYNNYKNNIILLINDYLSAGVIPNEDLKKNKRLLQIAVSKIINDSLKFKFSSTAKAFQNSEYVQIRFYLELAINIEYFVSSKSTKQLLEKLYKKNDNQLKLFILDNYIRKLKNIDKLDLTAIAKDNSSRYPLYELLKFYGKEKLFPKNYLKPQRLAESDLYINFLLYNGYKEIPKNFKYIKKTEIENHLYYVFTFNYTYDYNNNYDSTTNYIIEEAGLNKYKNQKVTATFVGLSGGYNLKEKISLIETTNNKVLWNIKKDKETIDDVIEKIKILTFYNDENNKEQIDNDKDKRKEKKKNKKPKKEVVINEKEELKEEKPKRKKGFRFSYILLFLLFILILCIIAFIVFLKRPDLINIENNKIKVRIEDTTKPSSIKNTNKFKEIKGTDLFNQAEKDYYVLLFKKKNKCSYYTYINTLIQNGYTIYYVDLSKEENRFLFSQNELNFTVSVDRYLKVEDNDFNFYVDSKENIIDELKLEVKAVEKANKEKQKEEKKKSNKTN